MWGDTCIYLILFICLSSGISEKLEIVPLRHYWREYVGVVPVDAFIAAYDINETPIFIGRAYLKNGGLIPCQIVPGVRQVHAAYAGINTVNSAIEILCGYSEDFEWLPTNKTNFHADVNDKHVIVGGIESKGDYNIGRVKHNGGWRIGKIPPFYVEPDIFYEFNGSEAAFPQFEVLLGKPLLYAVDVTSSKGQLCLKKYE